MFLQRDLESVRFDLKREKQNSERLEAIESNLSKEVEDLRELLSQSALKRREIQRENELLSLKAKNLHLEKNNIDNQRQKIDQESRLKISKLNEYIHNLGMGSDIV